MFVPSSYGWRYPSSPSASGRAGSRTPTNSDSNSSRAAVDPSVRLLRPFNSSPANCSTIANGSTSSASVLCSSSSGSVDTGSAGGSDSGTSVVGRSVPGGSVLGDSVLGDSDSSGALSARILGRHHVRGGPGATGVVGPSTACDEQRDGCGDDERTHEPTLADRVPVRHDGISLRTQGFYPSMTALLLRRHRRPPLSRSVPDERRLARVAALVLLRTPPRPLEHPSRAPARQQRRHRPRRQRLRHAPPPRHGDRHLGALG